MISRLEEISSITQHKEAFFIRGNSSCFFKVTCLLTSVPLSESSVSIPNVLFCVHFHPCAPPFTRLQVFLVAEIACAFAVVFHNVWYLSAQCFLNIKKLCFRIDSINLSSLQQDTKGIHQRKSSTNPRKCFQRWDCIVFHEQELWVSYTINRGLNEVFGDLFNTDRKAHNSSFKWPSHVNQTQILR